MAVISKLDVDEFVHKKVQLQYPYFELVELNDLTSLVVQLLKEGDVPLLGTYNGNTMVVKRIDRTAHNVDKLLRTHGSLIYCEEEGKAKTIHTTVEYLEAVRWT